jgi:hypothetical protein
MWRFFFSFLYSFIDKKKFLVTPYLIKMEVVGFLRFLKKSTPAAFEAGSLSLPGEISLQANPLCGISLGKHN